MLRYAAARRTFNRTVRILVSTPTFLPVVGGAEIGIHEIYSRLGQRHDVTIVTPRLRDEVIASYGSSEYDMSAYTVEHLAPELDRFLPDLGARAVRQTPLPYLVHLWRTARRLDADVVNFHFIQPHGAAIPALRRFAGIPVVLSLVARTDVFSEMSRFRREAGRFLVRESAQVLPNSEFYMHGEPPARNASVVPYGVDTARFTPAARSESLRSELGIKPRQPMLFTVQRLAPIKRVDMIIRSMAEIRQRHPEAVLVIGGQGQERNALEALVAKLDLQSAVRFAGYIADDALPAYFASSDIFVFHSMFETFGVVFAQAMACGVPIVAADTSCVSDVVMPSNGRLVPPYDTATFADAVSEILTDSDLRQQFHTENRNRATAEFNWDLIAAQYEKALAVAASAV